jgi:hypothetical protein
MTDAAACVLCAKTSAETPLIPFDYRGRAWRICSQHLPVLIHDPARLAGALPDADKLSPAEHED